MFVAVKSGNYECVRLLVEAGCDLNKQLYCGTTALHQAASEGMTRVRRMIWHEYALKFNCTCQPNRRIIWGPEIF